ncbi:hypothetical protein GCM10007160_43440 [Litchfieldella qijiaojingensis]|uniref:Uncharacterized protein n=1 Tax=Litchfieldella qijiaojingensis TaxID=980347 RepID=A0ABQ2ZG38_9GAMM|nr:hypothetical protein [Halomonas qijiaojingensis]GGY11801.1 hypothetical protein GCM10007160_43440 [Halomonas qijiaojingensis]
MNTVHYYLTSIRIEWEGTDGGLMPVFVEGNSEAILELKEKAMRDLIGALSDEDLFVNAHVLLTQISGIEYQAFPMWNGLNVEMGSDGTVTINPEQRYELARRWERWYQTEPRPKVLPTGN